MSFFLVSGDFLGREDKSEGESENEDQDAICNAVHELDAVGGGFSKCYVMGCSTSLYSR